MSSSSLKQIVAGSVFLSLSAGAALAQDSGWTYSVSGYLWFNATDVTADTPLGQVTSELSFSDAIKDLKFGFMGAVEARHGPWSLIGDLLYFNLETEGAPPGPVFDSVFADTKVTAASAYALYRVHEDPGFALDLGAGLRVFSGDVDITFVGPVSETVGQNKTWVDPLVAARMRVAFNEDWYGALFVDFGRTGKTQTWQALATVGYQVNERWSVQGGWRYMEARWDTDYGESKLEFSGPILGATYRF